MKKIYKTFFIDGDNDWELFGKGITRKVMCYDDKLMMVRVKFEKGTGVPSHSHPHLQCSMIESGKFELTIGDEKKILLAGDGFFVASGVAHMAVALEKGIIIDTFHPCREDFVNYFQIFSK